MGESSLTALQLDDPVKKVSEKIIEYGYDGSEITKQIGNQTVKIKMRRNYFATSKCLVFDKNMHSKVIFIPERKIDKSIAQTILNQS